MTSGLPSPAPEPGAWALMIAGIAGVGLMQRRRKKTLGLRFDKAYAALRIHFVALGSIIATSGNRARPSSSVKQRVRPAPTS